MKKTNLIALKNFGCNCVKKKIGNYISKEEENKMGEKELKRLIHEDFIQRLGKEAPLKKEIKEDEIPIELKKLSKEELQDYAKQLGLKPPHNAGIPNLIKRIEQELAK